MMEKGIFFQGKNLLDLSIIIVNYNTRIHLRNCLNSIVENTKGVDYEIILVDNASSDGSVAMLQQEFPFVRVIENTQNLGFAKANNLGIRVSQGEYILLLNSDTIVLDGCLAEVLRFAKENKDAGIIGCKVLNPDKTLQFSCYYQPNIFTELCFFTKTIIKDFWDPIGYFKYMKYWDHNQIRKVDCVSGCFFWLKRELIEQVGLLDETFFMYYEDSEFCRRVRLNSNYKIYYYPEAKIIHLKGKSSEFNNLETLKYCYKSATYYLQKCFGEKIKKIFSNICNLIWELELIIFLALRFNTKCKKKATMLKSLL